jgi:hypothetical protein
MSSIAIYLLNFFAFRSVNFPGFQAEKCNSLHCVYRINVNEVRYNNFAAIVYA